MFLRRVDKKREDERTLPPRFLFFRNNQRVKRKTERQYKLLHPVSTDTHPSSWIIAHDATLFVFDDERCVPVQYGASVAR